ncbi:MAG: CHASE2 domain-containing protein [Desulfobacteraceae bacterium]|nr:MAG: CHASE2 domain-containing protein [Desulfobacteraceae bacterium]
MIFKMASNPAVKLTLLRYGMVLSIAILLVGCTEFLGLLSGIDLHFYDLALRMRGARESSIQIVIAAIDENTLSRLGRWPIPRRHYARLLDFLVEVKAVGMDIAFSEPSEDDAELSEAIRRHGRVVLPVYIDQRFRISSPLEIFNSYRAGHIHLEQDIDGTVRRVFHHLEYGETIVSSFAASLYRIDAPERSFEKSPPSAAVISQREPMFINYYGPRGSFSHISMADVLEGKWPKGFFKGKTVLVGVTAPGIEENPLIPFSHDRNRMPGVEIHAHILNNLMDGNPIAVLDGRIRWLAVFCLFIFSFALFLRLGDLRGMLIWISGLSVALGIVFALLSLMNIWAAPAALLFAVSLSYLLAYVFNLERMKRLLMKAKEDWEESFDTIQDAITIHDRDGRVLRVNRAARETFGEPLLKLLSDRCRDFASTPVGAFPPGAPDVPEVVEEIFSPELNRHLEIKSMVRTDDLRQFAGMVQIARDITQRIEAEKNQRILEAQLIQAQKMEAIGTLAGGIAHDFNNMLAAMIGYTELARFHLPEGSDARAQLGEVLKAGERAKMLVQRILTFSRREAQEFGPVPVASVVKEALKLLRATLPTTIEIRTDIRSDGKVLGDPTQIHQILMNLCTNCYHAMLDGGGLLGVALCDTNIISDDPGGLSPGTYVRLSISDTGHGMTPEVMERIFEPYFTTKEKGMGTGLGMAVVHGIVQAHKGRITVQSAPGRGTTFDILLPRIEEEAGLVEELSAPLMRGWERILLVDDEKPLLDMGKQLLEELGYQVDTESSSTEALIKFKNYPDRYDLIITDLTMPGMTGEKLAAEMMRIREDIPVILCSGYSERMSAKKAVAMGVRAYLLKPLNVRDLSNTIRVVLDDPFTLGNRG